MRDELPVVDPDDLGPPVREGPIVGVLLAAGDSRRFGDRNKLLVDVDGGERTGGSRAPSDPRSDSEPMVRRAARCLTDAGLDRTIAVVGHEAERVRVALDGLDLEVVENPRYDQGQATTLAVGTRSARTAGAAAVCYALGDMPWVTAATVDALVQAYRADAGDPLAAAFEGHRGNPTLFDARHFAALEGVDGDVGGRELLLSDDRAALVETGDPGVRRDVDAPGDLPNADQ